MTDLVLTGGRVLGVDARSATVVVRDGVIVSAGADERPAPGAEVVDLQGGLLVPGFTDAHAHPIQGGIERRTCDLTGAKGEAAYLERIAQLRRRPSRAGLDRRRRLGDGRLPGRHCRPRPRSTPRSPTGRRTCVNRDHHGAWVNTRALHARGHRRATRPTPTTAGSSATPTARPTGTLHEGAMDLVERLVPKPEPLDR